MGVRQVVGLVVVLMALALASMVTAADSDELTGAKRCGSCHEQAYQVWSKSHHARAQKALDSKQSKDPRCVRCHGYSSVDIAGVQCESCHGSGVHYSWRYVMKDSVLSRIVGLVEPDEKTCRRCHTDTSPSVRVFEYDSLWESITHSMDAEPEKPLAVKALKKTAKSK